MNRFEENIDDWIEKYLRNELSDQDKQDFDAYLNLNPILQKEFEFQKDIIGGIIEYRKQELKTFIHENAGSFKSKSSYYEGWKYWSSAAAILLVSFGLGYFVFTNSMQQIENSGISQKLNQPEPEKEIRDSISVNNNTENEPDKSENSVEIESKAAEKDDVLTDNLARGLDNGRNDSGSEGKAEVNKEIASVEIPKDALHKNTSSLSAGISDKSIPKKNPKPIDKISVNTVKTKDKISKLDKKPIASVPLKSATENKSKNQGKLAANLKEETSDLKENENASLPPISKAEETKSIENSFADVDDVDVDIAAADEESEPYYQTQAQSATQLSNENSMGGVHSGLIALVVWDIPIETINYDKTIALKGSREEEITRKRKMQMSNDGAFKPASTPPQVSQSSASYAQEKLSVAFYDKDPKLGGNVYQYRDSLHLFGVDKSSVKSIKKVGPDLYLVLKTKLYKLEKTQATRKKLENVDIEDKSLRKLLME